MTDFERYLIKNSAAPAVKNVSGNFVQILDAEAPRVFEEEIFDSLMRLKMHGYTYFEGFPSIEEPAILHGINVKDQIIFHYGINIVPEWYENELGYNTDLIETFDKTIYIKYNKLDTSCKLMFYFYDYSKNKFDEKILEKLEAEQHIICPPGTVYVSFNLIIEKTLKNQDIIIYTAPVAVTPADYNYKSDSLKILNDIELFEFDEIDFNEMKIKKYSNLIKIDLENGGWTIVNSIPGKYDEYVLHSDNFDITKPILCNTLPVINQDEEIGIFMDNNKNIHIRVKDSVLNYISDTYILYYLEQIIGHTDLLIEGNIQFLENVNYLKVLNNNDLIIDISYKINMDILTRILNIISEEYDYNKS